MWNEEVKRRGIEKASLGKICLKFVKTRLVFMFGGLFMLTMSLLFVTVSWVYINVLMGAEIPTLKIENQGGIADRA